MAELHDMEVGPSAEKTIQSRSQRRVLLPVCCPQYRSPRARNACGNSSCLRDWCGEGISTMVNTFGTGDERAVAEYVKAFDFWPAAMLQRLNLLRPIYRQTTNYGHFGRPGLPWE